MAVDILSFLVGLVIGLAVAVALPVRDRLLALGRASRARARATQRYVTRSADARYRQDLERDCQTSHLAGDLIPLTEILVEPRFLSAPALPDPSLSDERGSVLDVVPQHHDLPFGYAPFNVETVGINDLAVGGKRLAILGVPGAGKTTALAAIALYALGSLEFETVDTLASAVDAAMQEGKDEEEIEKIRERQKELERRAMEQLRRLQLIEEGEQDAASQVADWRAYTPVLIHLADLELASEALGSRVDPAEPLVRAVQRRVGPVTQRTIPRFLYRRLALRQVLLLIDGYDELPPDSKAEKLAWLRRFVETYPDNLICAVGPAEGYGPLMELGFTPVFLRPWAVQDAQALAQNWAAAWPVMYGKGRRLAVAPDERAMQRATANARALTPLDLTLKVWAAYADDAHEPGRPGWYEAYVRRRLGAGPGEAARLLLEEAAVHSLDAGGFGLRREALQDFLTARQAELGKKPSLSVEEFIRNLSDKHRLMVAYGSGVLAFRHALVRDYLAASGVARDAARKPTDLLDEPAWRPAFPFLAARISLDEAAVALLRSEPDLLYGNLFEVARWLPDAPDSARWRGEVFKRLSRALVAPSQFPVVRERALGALVASRDPNTLFIFRQALRADDPQVRRLACLGLGALGTTEAIKDLAAMLGDEQSEVQLAAALALGAIGSERALEVMVRGLLEGDEALQRAVAEALAAIPGEGHLVIHEAAQASAMMVRRAAVFGLRRIKATWALVTIYRTMLEDSEWYVRAAAEQAFADARDPQAVGLVRYPATDEMSWLVGWAAARGEAVPRGEAANQVLIRALQQGEPPIREAAAETLGVLGYVPALKPLYSALRDAEPAVRDGVFRALTSLQMWMGAPLPGVY